MNLAGERIVTYMNDTNGWRAVGAGAADWKIDSEAILKGDFEYQHKTERDGSGYQLLGGTTVPDINRIYRSTMLGDQPWGLPDTYDTFNTGARLDYNLSHVVDGLRRGQLQPFAHPGQRDLRLRLLLRSVSATPALRRIHGSSRPTEPTTSTTTAIPASCASTREAEAMVTGHIKTGADHAGS